MKSIYLTILFGVRETLTHKNYVALFLLTLPAIFILLILIPVWSVPGNTFAAQLDIFTLQDYLTLSLISLLYALFVAMQVYALRQKNKIVGVGTAVGGGVGAVFAGIAGTAFCASCLAPLFALFGIGFGGVLFVLEYRFYFVAGVSVLMILAIYLTARKIKAVCENC